ncbi:MAG: hypothetical protein KQI62_18870 [Deltaproteobacteria bacterium]|nr:hypothetical protein [Deltaproteobacteria bacterium]
MAKKPPQQPQDIYDELLQDLVNALGTDLLSVVLFGSAAAGRYVKGRSDMNLLIMVSEQAQRTTSRLLPFAGKWAPAGVAPPLVMSPDYLAASTDVFPIEFLVMAANHKTLHGEDPLESLNLEPGHLRLQLEREIKGKVTALRTRLLASGGEARALTGLSREALPAFVAFFQAYLELTTGGFPSDPDEVLAAATEAGLKVEAFQKLGKVRAGELKPSPPELVALWEEGIAELDEISHQVDKLQV